MITRARRNFFFLIAIGCLALNTLNMLATAPKRLKANMFISTEKKIDTFPFQRDQITTLTSIWLTSKSVPSLSSGFFPQFIFFFSFNVEWNQSRTYSQNPRMKRKNSNEIEKSKWNSKWNLKKNPSNKRWFYFSKLYISNGMKLKEHSKKSELVYWL